MPFDLDDTIAAIASPPGGAARGIVRLSGPGVLECVERVFLADDGHTLTEITRPTAVSGRLRLAQFASPLPAELYLWPSGRSYTGQPVAELHTLGSPPLLEAALAACHAAGSRPARPGEFTLRAFLSGRIDLAQAEAVLGVIDAADANELEDALERLAGGLARPLGQLRQRLLDLLCDLEAGFDFSDEDLPFLPPERLRGQLAAAREAAVALADQFGCRHRAGPTTRAVLVGWTNAGKSSLFNALAGQPGALVSRQPGTTRDYLTTELDLEGVRCVLVDTAGVEPGGETGEDALSAASRRVADRQRELGQIEILCLDASRRSNAWEESQLRRPPSPNRIVAWTKSDLAGRDVIVPRKGTVPSSPCEGRGVPPSDRMSGPLSLQGASEPAAIRTSSKTGEGLDALRVRLREAVVASRGEGGAVAATSGAAIRGAIEAVDRAARLAEGRPIEELVAAEVRLALDQLGPAAGAVCTEDILDRLFSRFCVGK